jgi:ribosome biogenesis protein ENP2
MTRLCCILLVDYRRRLELIQDFEFPDNAGRIKSSADGQYVIATGVYPPQVRCFELSQLSLKFKRHIDCDVVQFQILSDDYSKLVFLRSDRVLEFHAQFGTYYSLRIPKFGRDLVYYYPSCDLIAVSITPEIYRFNLEQGRFLRPLTSSCPSLNVAAINPVNALLAFGSEDGVVECWDYRQRKAIGSHFVGQDVVNLMNGLITSIPQISAIQFGYDGLTLAVGSSSGQVLLYDLRSSVPMRLKDHQYDAPIVDIKFHGRSRNIISSCKKIVKIWNKDTGANFCGVEPNADINDVCVMKDSGLFFVAGEHKKMFCYYIPELGPAPNWCSFLDNITEELEEEKQNVIYQDYKFVTRQELEKLGVTKLIGTPYLRAYMHGFFMDIRLYTKLRALANPDEYKEWLKQKVKERIEKKREGRISAHKASALPKVNAELAAKLLQQQADSTSLAERPDKPRKSGVRSNLLSDERFRKLFEDPRFQIDKGSEAYKRVHPVERGQQQMVPIEEKETPLSEDYSLVSEEEDDAMNVISDESERSDSEDKIEAKEKRQFVSKKKRRAPKLFEARSAEMKNPLAPKDVMKEKLKSISFEKRVTQFQTEEQTTLNTRTGNLSMKFTPTASPSQRNSKKKKKTTPQ